MTQPADKLITGGSEHFLPHLCAAIAAAAEIDLAVAFVKTTGLRLLLPDLLAAIERADSPARLRVITSDYLDVTDPEALRLLLLLLDRGAAVRVYESAGSSFHMKAYLFTRLDRDGQIAGSAFIGSSNISRQALKDGLEWNYRIDYPGDDGFLEARSRFDALFAHPRAVALTDAWIARYEARRLVPVRTISPGSNEIEAPPVPTPPQREALTALESTRQEGYRRGLVVMATGLGKTWLAAFDVEQMGARRVLFVAHREEILNQAAETFLRIRPKSSIGFYRNETRSTEVDVLCASVQTLSRAVHLDRFPPQHFDYVVIDEFHHAAAATYRRLLKYFSPRFLLGLTATPDRTDQSDILSLCDDNLVFTRDLFAGIRDELLSPFHYYGIYDESVEYDEIPWRNGRFDPEQLSSKLATLARARHALKQWRDKAQRRTLAFCVSVRHADFMAEQFATNGVAAAAIHGSSPISRGDALERLTDGRLQVIFSVDLFNEGVDLPQIDTILMLRPTESKILFLQQLGRGLRRADGKERLVVLDFIGNHRSFLHKPEALFGTGSTYSELAAFARRAEAGKLELPRGCYVNYDLKLLDFLKALPGDGILNAYRALEAGLGRRPALSEFFRSGANVRGVQKEYGSWFQFVDFMQGLDDPSHDAAAEQREFLREVETTAMTKSFKMILLEAFQELDGWRLPPTLDALARSSFQVLHRRRPLLADLPADIATISDGDDPRWRKYWRDNPVNAWIGGNRGDAGKVYFSATDASFAPNFPVAAEQREVLSELVQELVDYRFAAYELRKSTSHDSATILPFRKSSPDRVELPYFPNLRIACGHFRTGKADAEEHRSIGAGHGPLAPEHHFIARASGNSMNGGKHPIRDGDYLLLERITPGRAGSITGNTVVIEKCDGTGDDQYLLRLVTKTADGRYVLKANNPDYEDMEANEEMRTLARFKAVLDPLELAVGQSFAREEIPELFGEIFNAGNWHSGHIALNDKKAHVLLVTLNKQGKSEDHRYIDHWIDEHTFHWQSQNSTTPNGKRGRELIEHATRGIAIHLFVRESKLAGGKAARFTYHGPVRYLQHSGSAPMSVIFAVDG